jgi:uncharacterized protein (TIRG00374 family)
MRPANLSLVSSWLRPLNLLKLGGLLLLLAIALFGVDFGEALEAIGDADWWLAAAALLVLNLALLIRAFRWKVLATQCGLHYEKPIDYYAVFYAGWFANWLLPQGIGAAARLAVVSDSGRSFGRGLGAIIIERVADGSAAAVLGLLTFGYVIRSGQAELFGLVVGLACAAVLLLGVAIVVLRRLGPRYGLRETMARWAIGRQVLNVLDETFLALGEIGRREIGFVAALSMIATSGLALAFYLTALSLDIDAPFLLIVAAYALVNLSLFLPISIQGLGPREGILIVALAASGESNEAGVALGILWFVLLTLSRLPGILGWLHTPSKPDSTPAPRLAER